MNSIKPWQIEQSKLGYLVFMWKLLLEGFYPGTERYKDTWLKSFHSAHFGGGGPVQLASLCS